MDSAQAGVTKMEMLTEDSIREAEIKQELMELDLVDQCSASCDFINDLSVELKGENESPLQTILVIESNDSTSTSLGNQTGDQSGSDLLNNLFDISESNSTVFKQLLPINENPENQKEFVLNESMETLNDLKVLPEKIKQEFEDDSSTSDVKYVNKQDYLEIGETVITSPGANSRKKQYSAATPTISNQKKPCSNTIEVVPCSGLKCVQQLVENGMLDKLSASEKAELITGPRPTPNLEIRKTYKTYRKNFKRSLYETSWIAGCSHVNKLFCWWCIFFSIFDTSWRTKGYDDLKNVSQSIKRHQISQKHLNAGISFHNFRKQHNFILSLSSIPRPISDEANRYNRRVDYNRSVFKRLIDVVCHLVQLELTLRSQDESESSLNKGNFLELVILLSKYDHVLAKQMQENGTRCLTHKLQNDIIRSISDVAKAQIEAEIKESQFVSVIVDETPVANSRDQLFLVFRYSFENKIYERFMGFIDCPNCTVDEISQVVLDIIKKNECEKKLIAQSYDGISITAAVRNGVHLKVNEVIPQVHYVWCNSHTFNMVLSKSCNSIGDVSSFFFSLFGLVNFFSNNEKRLRHYDMFCSKRLPDISPASRWSYLSCIVITAYEQKQNLRNLLTEITDEPQNWDGETNFAAENLYDLVTSFQFNFYLEVFQAIFQKTDFLNCVKQASEVLLSLTPQIKELTKWLKTFKSHFSILYENALQHNSPPPSSRIFPCAKKRYKHVFVQIIENITAEITNRHIDISNLQFLQLLNEDRFGRELPNAINFSNDKFKALLKFYGNHFVMEALESQLMSIYSAEELKGFSLSQLVCYISENTLKDMFPDLIKLINLVTTIQGSAESESSNLNKRVHAYLSNVQEQDSLTDLATIVIEKDLLLNLRCSTTFYDDVMKSFSSIDPSFELEYKYK